MYYSIHVPTIKVFIPNIKIKDGQWTHILFNYIKSVYVSLYLQFTHKLYYRINKYNIKIITSISPLPSGLHHQQNSK